MNFKIGDKVRCKGYSLDSHLEMNHWQPLIKGVEYIITMVLDNSFYNNHLTSSPFYYRITDSTSQINSWAIQSALEKVNVIKRSLPDWF